MGTHICTTQLIPMRNMIWLGAIILFTSISRCVNALQYTVGDSVGWGIGNDLEKWATLYTFHVGDNLYFPYPSGQHSVLLVTEEDYKSCNINNPIASDNGAGNMAITLISAEVYYFICGVPGHCEQGLHLSIPVHKADASTTSPSIIAPPPPVEETTPSYNGGTPSLATPPPYHYPPPYVPPSTNTPAYYSANTYFHPIGNFAIMSKPLGIFSCVIMIVLSFAFSF